MMSKVKKDSKIEWIAEVPEHWEVKSLKSILAERKEKNDPIKTNFILSLTFDRGVIPYSEKDGGGGNKAKEDISEYKLAYPNDIVLNSMNVITGSVGLSKYFGAVSPVYYTLYMRREEDIVEYFNDIFQTNQFQESLIGYGNGILIKQSEGLGKFYAVRMRIPMSKLNTVQLPYPPVEEQRKIATFLEQKISEINNVIKQTTNSIDEYKKYKQSLITEAVTKGINSDVEMKDSGVEWIGRIPSTWDIIKGKHTLNLLKRLVLENDEVITCFRDGEVTLRKNRRETGFTFSEKEIGYQGIEPGDLVIHGMDGFAGAIGISDSRGKGSPVLNVCNSLQNKEYIMYYLRSMAYNNVFTALATGIRIRSCDLRWNKIAELPFPVPGLDEQEKIVKHINSKCEKIDKLIQQKQQLLIELEAYKKSLIYECVTGKVEV